MLNKRERIVDYSSSSSNSPTRDKVVKKKKVISYDNLPISNPIKKLTEYLENEEKFSKLKSELEEKDTILNKKYNTININSVRGDLKLNLPEATFSSKSSKRGKNPFYYNVMEEIYKEQIIKEKKKEEEEEENPENPNSQFQEGEMEMVHDIKDSNIRVKEISQKDQVQFNEREYLARKEKRDQLLNIRANLNPTSMELKKNHINAMAFKQLEKEALGPI